MLSNLKPILTKNALSSIGFSTSIVTAEGDYLYASNGNVSMRIPYNGAPFSVVGADIDKATSILDDYELAVNDASVVIKRGRSRITIAQCEERATRCDDSGEHFALPPDFTDVLRAVAPFISTDQTKRWACAVQLRNGYAYATNNVCLVRANCATGVNVSLPDHLVKILLTRQQPVCMAVSQSNIAFIWDDRVIVSTTANSLAFPDGAVKMIDSAPLANVEITDEWRAAFELAATLASDELFIENDGIRVNRNSSKLQSDVQLMPLSTTTAWNPNFLAPAIGVATHFDPSPYPSPAPFRGDRVKGLIMGRR